MCNTDDIIRYKALLRIAHVFNIPIDALSDEMEFDKDLKTSFVSTFKRNELDIISDDLRDAATSRTLKKLESEEIVINTVDDYVSYMIFCYAECPRMVVDVLEGGVVNKR